MSIILIAILKLKHLSLQKSVIKCKFVYKRTLMGFASSGFAFASLLRLEAWKKSLGPELLFIFGGSQLRTSTGRLKKGIRLCIEQNGPNFEHFNA